MLAEMKKAKKVIGMEIEHGRGWIYVLPSGDCRAMVNSADIDPFLGAIHQSSLILDYVCFCTNPPIEGGIKGTEQQLEVLMTPSFSPLDW